MKLYNHIIKNAATKKTRKGYNFGFNFSSQRMQYDKTY